MRYRKLGKTDLDVSILGFGAMRLPMVGNPDRLAGFDPKVPIDEEHADRMVRHALDVGVNYFDTAYGYHGGQSERYIGKVLAPVRTKVMIASKLPVWNIEKPEDFDRVFEEQLGKLRTDYLDVYLVHGLNRTYWDKMKALGVLGFLDRLKAEGRIRVAGFSFHDEIKVFKSIIDAYDWDVCQIQYNFYDRAYQAGTEGLEYAADRKIGVVVMEPLRGGQLVDRIPTRVQEQWDAAPVRRSPAEWAMRWVWNHPGVSTVLTGSSSLQQLQEHTRVVRDAAPNSLSEEELARFDRVRALYREMVKVDCTGCAYCMPCPNGIDIPHNFQLYNDHFMFPGPEFGAFFYNNAMPEGERASACVECGDCMDKCPQQLDIIRELKEVHGVLAAPPKQG
ncbi:MAG: aldo/keto reductase [Acidobacteriota bacterium]|jgi:predicted aldo/keto reductase-like oxidoreductase|nr:aldo/keto reductase [Acidobacteriota bacterium]NLT33893.1 aldo/keto reductase [Acidobacteriota bacterium]